MKSPTSNGAMRHASPELPVATSTGIGRVAGFNSSAAVGAAEGGIVKIIPGGGTPTEFGGRLP